MLKLARNAVSRQGALEGSQALSSDKQGLFPDVVTVTPHVPPWPAPTLGGQLAPTNPSSQQGWGWGESQGKGTPKTCSAFVCVPKHPGQAGVPSDEGTDEDS
jgi:hypothetical protein